MHRSNSTDVHDTMASMVTCFHENIAPLARVLDGKFARDPGATNAPTHDSVTSVKQAARRAMVSNREYLSQPRCVCCNVIRIDDDTPSRQEFEQIFVGIFQREHSTRKFAKIVHTLLCCTSCLWTETSAYVQVNDGDTLRPSRARISIQMHGFVAKKSG